MIQQPVKRAYRSAGREEQARALRARVVRAAQELFVAQGYAVTTTAQVAAAAEVSPQLVFKAFGTKAGLLSRVIDVALVGDDEEIPMSRRPSVLAVQAEPTQAGKCALQARHTRLVAERVAPTIAMLRSAADADAEARRIYEVGEDRRLQGARNFVADLTTAGPLRRGLTKAAAADAVWALAPDVLWTMLVGERSWSPGRFERHIALLLGATLLGADQIEDVRRRSELLNS